MKVAVIGAGNNARGHAQGLAVMEDVQVVGIADPVVDKAEALASDVGGRAYADHRVMLDEAKPDAICISSPCWLHAQQAADCLAAGVHVLCEKPMALSLEDCDTMIAAARQHGVVLMICQTTRYIAQLVELQRLFASGRCGELVSAWSTRMGYHKGDATWRLDGEQSGGIVFEWEVHEIDFVRGIGGAVSQVYARTAYSRAAAPNFLDHFSALLTFAGGGYGNLEASQSCAIAQGGRGFVGTQGAAQAQGNSVRLRTTDMDEDEIIEVEGGNSQAQQDGDFIRAIRAGADSPVSGEDARANIEIGLAIIESGRTGQVVDLPLESQVS